MNLVPQSNNDPMAGSGKTETAAEKSQYSTLGTTKEFENSLKLLALTKPYEMLHIAGYQKSQN